MGEAAASEKVDFAGEAWVEAVRGVLGDLVAEHADDDTRFSACEIFTDAPAHVAAAGTAAWHFYVEGKSVRIGMGAVDDADVTIRADYETALPGARAVYTPEYLAKMATMPPPDPPPDIKGDTSVFPPWLVELHNRMAVITA